MSAAPSAEGPRAVVDRALRAGGTEVDTQDYGFLRSRCFRDPDGHQWEILWVDPAAASRHPAHQERCTAYLDRRSHERRCRRRPTLVRNTERAVHSARA